MKDINQWVFVDAGTVDEAMDAVVAAINNCSWASEAWILDDTVLRGEDVDFELAVRGCAEEQKRHAHTFALSCHPSTLLELAEEHDPLTTWDDGGVQVLYLSAIADIVAGLWTPWSAGFDVSAGRADYADLLARLEDAPERQWAVGVHIRVDE